MEIILLFISIILFCGAEVELELDPPPIACVDQVSTSSEGSCFNCDLDCKNNEDGSDGICQFGVCYCRTCSTAIHKP